jgi:hypothetical protein
MTVHDDIDNLLAADLHGELTDSEQSELHSHLLDCPGCRQAHQETKIMNDLLEEKLEKPDAALERRILANFRERVPEKTGFFRFVACLWQFRSAQIVGVAALLLALIQIGRLVTGEKSSTEQYAVAERVIVTGSNIPTAEEGGPRNVFDDLRKGTAGSAGTAAEAETSKFESQTGPPKMAQLAPAASPAIGGNISQFASGGAVNTKTAHKAAVEPAPEFHEEMNAPRQKRPTTESSSVPAAIETGRKLIRNARVDLEIINFEEAAGKITQFANEDSGYIATSGSQKQANGKLRGEVVVKVVPENLDRFLQKVRGLGELKNQTLGADDVTKAYFDTDARLKNARVMEQRLVDMLKTKTGKVSDLLQVEKELGRVREEIEKMQGELKYWDSQVQFATVTISLAERDLEEPAKFLLKERAQLSLYAAEVEKIYNEIKALASSKVQITNAQLDRDTSGHVSARLSILIVPEESDGVINNLKSFGRVGNFQTQTERIAQGGNGLSENAKTKRDKVEVNVTIARETDEQPVQETSLRILTPRVEQSTARLKAQVAKSGAEIRNSTFSRDPDGRELANISLRVAMKDYPAVMKSLDQLGQVKDVSVQRHDRTDKTASEETAPADLSIQIYSEGQIVSSDTGLVATIRRTIAQSAGAIMWSVRMIGVAIAFLAPWVIALVALIWIVRKIVRARR